MKSNAIIRIVIFSLTSLILLAILASALLANSLLTGLFDSGILEGLREITSHHSSGDVIMDGTGMSGEYDAESIRHLEIDWVSGTIIIRPGETNTVRIEESAVSDEDLCMNIRRSGSRLIIQYCEDNKVSIFNGSKLNADISKDLVITVPKDWVCESLEIDTASARVEIENLQIYELDFDGASGEFILDNCLLGDLDIDTASGDVTFSGSLNVLDFDAASASFSGVFVNAPKRIDMDSMSGDLDITLPADCGFTATVDSMSGAFHSDFSTTSSNGNYTYGDGSCKISVNGMSADVRIRRGE